MRPLSKTYKTEKRTSLILFEMLTYFLRDSGRFSEKESHCGGFGLASCIFVMCGALKNQVVSCKTKFANDDPYEKTLIRDKKVSVFA